MNLGSVRILEIDAGTGWQVVACVSSMEISEESDFLASQLDDNGFETSRPNNQGYAISIDAVQILDDVRLSYIELKTLKRNRTLIDWRVNGVSGSGITYDEGSGYINEISESANAGSALTFSMAITGYGEPIQSVT